MVASSKHQEKHLACLVTDTRNLHRTHQSEGTLTNQPVRTRVLIQHQHDNSVVSLEVQEQKRHVFVYSGEFSNRLKPDMERHLHDGRIFNSIHRVNRATLTLVTSIQIVGATGEFPTSKVTT